MMDSEKHLKSESLWVRASRSTAFWMFMILLGLVLGFGLLSNNFVFFNYSNFFTIGLNASQLVLLSVGM